MNALFFVNPLFDMTKKQVAYRRQKAGVLKNCINMIYGRMTYDEDYEKKFMENLRSKLKEADM